MEWKHYFLQKIEAKLPLQIFIIIGYNTHLEDHNSYKVAYITKLVIWK